MPSVHCNHMAGHMTGHMTNNKSGEDLPERSVLNGKHNHRRQPQANSRHKPKSLRSAPVKGTLDDERPASDDSLRSTEDEFSTMVRRSSGSAYAAGETPVESKTSLRSLKRSSALYSNYDQTMYLDASKIFTALQHRPRDDGSFEAAQRRKAFKDLDKTVPFIVFESDNERRLTYELAYSTLKYQFVLEDLLDDIAFFVKYPGLTDELTLVAVVFTDYMQRKFITRELHPEETTYLEVTEVEDCIVESKIKLDAALARRRIKECARNVEDLLPFDFKSKVGNSAENLLTYAWINFNKTSMNYVLRELEKSGYQEISDSKQPITDMDFYQDLLLSSSLIFSPQQAPVLSNHRLVQEGCLVIQDKTSLFGPHSIVPLLNNKNEDVLLIDYNSGASAAHLSSLMKSSKKSGYIYLFGVRSSTHKNEIQSNLDRLDAKNVRLIDEALDSIAYDDVRLANVKATLLYGRCSKTAVLDPVSFVITEGEDVSILQDLSQGRPASEKIHEMSRKNLLDLRNAIRFPRMQALVYITRSMVDTENEKIVMKALESYNDEDSHRKHPYRVTPPTLIFDDTMAKEKRNDRYYNQAPSEKANGCFVAFITKEIEHVKEGHQTILQRAAATGLLDETQFGEGDLEHLEKSTLKLKKSKSKLKNKKLPFSASVVSSKKRMRKPSTAKRMIAFGSGSSTSVRPQLRQP